MCAKRDDHPLSSEHGTYMTVTARFWPWLSGDSLSFFQVVPFYEWTLLTREVRLECRRRVGVDGVVGSGVSVRGGVGVVVEPACMCARPPEP